MKTVSAKPAVHAEIHDRRLEVKITDPEWFDEKYGNGRHAQLVQMLKKVDAGHMSLAEVGREYKVTRESARKWYYSLCANSEIQSPESRNGSNGLVTTLNRELNNLFSSYPRLGEYGVTKEYVSRLYRTMHPEQPKKMDMKTRRRIRNSTDGLLSLLHRLFDSDLFKAFYRCTTSHLSENDINFIAHSNFARDGFRNHIVKLRDKRVLLRKASKWTEPKITFNDVYSLDTKVYDAEYVWYWLGNDNFLFIPASELPGRNTTYVESNNSKYSYFKNNFDDLDN